MFKTTLHKHDKRRVRITLCIRLWTGGGLNMLSRKRIVSRRLCARTDIIITYWLLYTSLDCFPLLIPFLKVFLVLHLTTSLPVCTPLV